MYLMEPSKFNKDNTKVNVGWIRRAFRRNPPKFAMVDYAFG
jgi:hypothetical protein